MQLNSNIIVLLVVSLKVGFKNLLLKKQQTNNYSCGFVSCFVFITQGRYLFRNVYFKKKQTANWVSVCLFLCLKFFQTSESNTNKMTAQKTAKSENSLQLIWLKSTDSLVGGGKAAPSWFRLIHDSIASPSAVCRASVWFATDYRDCAAPNPAVWVRSLSEDSHYGPVRDTSSPAFARGQWATCELGWIL